MCGIAGIVTQGANNYKHNMAAMVASLHHRGPDGNGTHYFNNCALGHTRLSIIDIDGGHQPMHSENQQQSITFNGEIYGYKNLKQSLDYQFSTNTDTEVILALYKKHGIDMLKHLPGMFAFSLWDEQKQLLFCARDRFGEKPFYYSLGKNNEFIFGSEIKSILASGLIDKELNPDALTHYLQNLYVHPTHSIYSNIQSLPPAHYLVYQNGEIATEKYWDYPEINDEISPDDAIDKFETLFSNSIKKQLVADVPVGAFLSGGLDSSAIVATASTFTDNLNTFSFGFENSFSELPFAKEVAKKYCTDHHELTEEKLELEALLFEMLSVYDEPFADTSNIPTYLIAKKASKHTKVVLSGDGGDELMCGYSSWYRPLFNMANQMNRPMMIRTLLLASRKLLRSFRIKLPKELTNSAQGASMANRFQSISEAHLKQQHYFTNSELTGLGLKPWHSQPANSAQNTIDHALKMDINNYMPGDILVKTDRATMANGLELRAPFLDKELAEFCITIPSNLKINTSNDKDILRQAFTTKLPDSILNRKKQGFGAPVKQWLERQDMTKLKHQYLLDNKMSIHSMLDSKNITRITQSNSYQTWALLVLSIWLEANNI